MLPYITILGHDITSYSICALIGIAISTVYVSFTVKNRNDLDSVQLVNIAVISGLGAFIGAHILFSITKRDMFLFALSNSDRVFSSFRSFVNSFLDIFGGMVFYGGLLGGIIAGIYYIKHLRHICLNPWVYADIYAPAIPLFHIFGRVGCFLGGCCYGIESNWGFTYHIAPVPEANNVVRIPIQLIEAGINFIIFLILHKMNKKEHPDGMIMLYYLIMYSFVRFILEFYRGDTIRGIWLGLSTSQWISLGLFVVSINILIQKKYLSKKSQKSHIL